METILRGQIEKIDAMLPEFIRSIALDDEYLKKKMEQGEKISAENSLIEIISSGEKEEKAAIGCQIKQNIADLTPRTIIRLATSGYVPDC